MLCTEMYSSTKEDDTAQAQKFEHLGPVLRGTATACSTSGLIPTTKRQCTALKPLVKDIISITFSFYTMQPHK